jgi:hypothetical protein
MVNRMMSERLLVSQLQWMNRSRSFDFQWVIMMMITHRLRLQQKMTLDSHIDVGMSHQTHPFESTLTLVTVIVLKNEATVITGQNRDIQECQWLDTLVYCDLLIPKSGIVIAQGRAKTITAIVDVLGDTDHTSGHTL